MDIKRETLTTRWYEYTAPSGNKAGLRNLGVNQWGVYFRDGNNHPIEPTPVAGQELRFDSYTEGKAFIITTLIEETH